jgi:hypothetical protein
MGYATTVTDMWRLHRLRGDDEAQAYRKHLCPSALIASALGSMPVLISLANSLGACATLLEVYVLLLALAGGVSPLAPQTATERRIGRTDKSD